MNRFKLISITSLLWYGIVFSTLTRAQDSKNSITAHSSDPLIKGILFLKNGEKEKGYKFLEENFDKIQVSSQKAEFARILAHGSSKYLKKSRHYFAEFALNYSKTLSPLDRGRLLIVLGDGYFDDVLIEKSQNAFEKAIQIDELTLSDKEYAVFKLGWVYLNKKRPDQTYELWDQWLNKNSDFGLRSEILSQTAKVWIESWVHTRRGSQTPGKYGIQIKNKSSFPAWNRKEEQVLIATGFYEGILREKIRDPQDLIQHINVPAIRQELINKVLREKNLLSGDPCQVIKWLRFAQADSLDHGEAQGIIAACARVIDEKKDKKRKKEGAQQLAEVYPLISLKGVSRLPRAYTFHLAQDYEKATCEYEGLIREILGSSRDEVTDESLSQIIYGIDFNMRQVSPFPKQCQWNLLGEALIHSEFIYQWFERAQPKEKENLLRILQSAPIREIVLKSSVWTHKTPRWVETELPQLLLYSHKRSVSLEKQIEAFYQVYPTVKQDFLHKAPDKNNPQWNTFLELVNEGIKTSQFQLVKTFLETVIPYSQISFREGLRQWALFFVSSKSVPPKIFLTIYQGVSKKDEKDSALFTHLCVQTSNWALSWAEWPTTGRYFEREPAYGRPLFQSTLNALLNSDKNKSDLELETFYSSSPSSEFKKYIQYAVELVKQPTSNPPEAALPSSLKGMDLAKEIERLKRVRFVATQYSSLEFPVNEKLSISIEKNMNLLQELIRNYEEVNWKSPLIYQRVQESVHEAAQKLSNAIAEIPIDEAESKEQLLQLSNTVKKWNLGT